MRAGTLILSIVIVSGSAVAQTESLDLVDAILVEAGGKRVPCSPELLFGEDAHEVVCAITGADFKHFRKSVRAASRGREMVMLPGGDWASSNGLQETRFFVARELFVMRFDDTTGTAVLLPDRSCFPQSALAGVADARTEGVAAARIERRIEAHYPTEARAERQPGFVMAQVVVSPEGSVANACVLWAGPTGYGFEQSALAAVRVWRFHPAARDGARVPYRLNVSVTWEP